MCDTLQTCSNDAFTWLPASRLPIPRRQPYLLFSDQCFSSSSQNSGSALQRTLAARNRPGNPPPAGSLATAKSGT